MRFVALSDHAGQMLADARQRRAVAEQSARQRYQRELAAYRERAGQPRERRAQARARGRLLSWLWWALVPLWRHDRPPAPPASLIPSHGEAAIVQLTEPLQLLEQFLERRGPPVRIQPVVLLNHPKARIDRCSDDVGVVVLTSTARLVRLVLGASAEIGASQLAQVEHLVVRDHRFHAAGRRA